MRVIPPKNNHESVRIARVLTHGSYRRCGSGTKMVNEAISFYLQHYPTYDIKIKAQAHLKGFYEMFGLKLISNIYLEDCVEHIDMVITDI